MSKLRVRLVGGVGNQLFCYYAGAALAGVHNLELVADAHWTHPSVTLHESSITDFSLPANWILPKEKKESGQSTVFSKKLSLDRISHHLPLIKRIRSIGDFSDELGWNPKIFEGKPPNILWGYFQSWRYIEIANRFGYPLRPELKSQSSRLLELVAMAHDVKPISLHIRRGDYLSVANFGLLTTEYYEEAIKILRNQGNEGPIWVFSDDVTTAQNMIAAENYVTGISAVEQLYLMSQCNAHVIANSTFSWWGAWMDEKQGDVIAPSPWFRHGPEINELIPPNWQQIPHQ